MEKAGSKEKNAVIEEAVRQIKDKFGEGIIMRFGETTHMDVDVVSTGCLSLDIALGVGGVPRGRIMEIFGPEASGKTTLAQHIVAEVQKIGGVAAFVDAEHALDPERDRHIVERALRIKLMKKPQALLGEGKRHAGPGRTARNRRCDRPRRGPVGRHSCAAIDEPR